MTTEARTMTVEVWSDIMCPFCFLGKHRFATALQRFPQREDVAVVWRSFQLNPSLRTDPTITVNEYLARTKGIDVRQAAAMNDRLTSAGAAEGIEYRFDRAVVANTFDAHRFLHYAADHDRQDAAMEHIFTAYFSEGRNVADHAVLAAIGDEIGLDAADIASMLASDRYVDEVRADIAEAEELGIQGVPFFVFDRRYAVSGAQDSSVFLRALEQSWATGG